MFATSFALMPNELGVSALTTNSILAIAGFILLVLPAFFVLKAQANNSTSAFSSDSISKNLDQGVVVETSPKVENEADIDN